jgi:hypothetical protein
MLMATYTHGPTKLAMFSSRPLNHKHWGKVIVDHTQSTQVIVDHGTTSQNLTETYRNWFWIQRDKFCSAGAFNVIDTSDNVQRLPKKLELELSENCLGDPKIQRFIIIPSRHIMTHLKYSKIEVSCVLGESATRTTLRGPLWGSRILYRFAPSQRHDDVHGELHHHAWWIHWRTKGVEKMWKIATYPLII